MTAPRIAIEAVIANEAQAAVMAAKVAERRLLGFLLNGASRAAARNVGLRPHHFRHKPHGELFDDLIHPCPPRDQVLAAKLAGAVADIHFEGSHGVPDRAIEELARKVMAAAAKPKPQARPTRPAVEREPAEVPREIRWLNQVVGDRDLPPLCLHLAYALAQLWNQETDDAWPSQQTLSKLLNLNRTTIKRLANRLAERGHLEVTTGRGRGHSSRYRPLLKKPERPFLFSEGKAENVAPGKGGLAHRFRRAKGCSRRREKGALVHPKHLNKHLRGAPEGAPPLSMPLSQSEARARSPRLARARQSREDIAERLAL